MYLKTKSGNVPVSEKVEEFELKDRHFYYLVHPASMGGEEYGLLLKEIKKKKSDYCCLYGDDYDGVGLDLVAIIEPGEDYYDKAEMYAYV